MSTGRKCKNCGSSEIEVDPARGDAVCTNCGSVLEDNIIVAETEFQENAHGAASIVGQFVSAESTGVPKGYGASFMGVATESREVTIRKAKQGITMLSQQLRLKQHCIDIACNFFKMALSRHLTQGRPASHIHAACVYITCRTEGTDHLLIDISDVLQICCYQLGRAYLQLSRALCIKIPSIDPCLYILRFANQLDFGDKTQEVTTTALRLVQRMKRDSLHSGRRPSGLCGAALLLAARLHEFSRDASDLVRVVKVHESTLKKRLLEFGDTPSGALTLDEFLTVDLEEEQDPPAFIAARKKDRERLKKLSDKNGDIVLTQLQKEIESQLDKDLKRKQRSSVLDTPSMEEGFMDKDVAKFVQESLGDLDESFVDDPDIPATLGLGPDYASMGLILDPDIPPAPGAIPNTPANLAHNKTANIMEEHDETLDDADDDEINAMIMSKSEVTYKTQLWYKMNASYLADQKIKAEKLAKEKEEGKSEKKRRKTGTRKKAIIGPSSTAGEAIEKMLQEKKISSKINYDILMSLNRGNEKDNDATTSLPKEQLLMPPPTPDSPTRKKKLSTMKPLILTSPLIANNKNKRSKKVKPPSVSGLPVVLSPKTPATPKCETPKAATNADEPIDEDYDEEEMYMQEKNTGSEMESISQLLRSQEDDNEDYAFDEY